MLANKESIQIVGGAELQQVIIAKGLVRRGYPVSMICFDYGQEDPCEIDGITVYKALRPNQGLPGLRFIWPRLTSFWTCLGRANADIYYQRAASVLTGLTAAFCLRHGRKSIYAIAVDGDPQFRFRRDRWIFDYGIRHVDRLVAQNPNQQQYFKDRFGRDSILIPSIYNKANALQAHAVRDHVLWVATIRERKRADLFLDLAQALPQYKFTMVGGPGVREHALFEAISQRAKRLDNLDFAGFVPYAEIDRYFDRAILFVSTSNKEGVPNTFMDAWARGVPTVSFFDSGARANGKPIGRIVGSIEEMTDAVADLLENDAARSRLGEECRKYVESYHSPDRALDLYEEVFRSLL